MRILFIALLLSATAFADIKITTTDGVTTLVPGDLAKLEIVAAPPPPPPAPVGTVISATGPTTLDIKNPTKVSGFSNDNTGVAFDWGFMQGVGSYLEYNISVAQAGNYTLDLNYAVGIGDSGMDVLIGGTKLVSVALPNTGSFATYQDAKVNLALPQGNTVLRVSANNANYINIASITLAPQTAVVTNPPPPPPPTTGTPAQDFVSGLKLGVNIERGNAWGMGDFGSGTVAFSYLKSVGIDHVRMFYPWRPSLQMGGSAGVGIAPTAQDFDRILAAVKNANAAGLKVFLDLCDVMSISEMTSLTDGYLDMASKEIAKAGLDPKMVVVGAVNEYEGDTNANWNPIRAHVLSILRTNLPNFTLSTGPAYWKDYLHLIQSDFQASTDTNVIYEVHSYDPSENQASTWSNWAAALKNWSAAHNGAPVVFGEMTSDATSIAAAATQASNVHASPWAITSGANLRMNVSGSDYHLTSAITQAYQNQK